ncbi:MAG TPA: flavin reductase family protein [Streptosporangiaceae bacterium]|jgi:3-hydroxy-9,10-secoandrosta-1,3,5(10)-triene-9,17-dione monooxygenase reductase component|nr:flavin reductase family protein [Streptosporangiaceae bacterium]
MNSRREALAVTVGGASPADDARMPSGNSPVSHEPAPQKFRQVLGHFCTGVTVVTAMDDGEPVGFACQAFAALSLDPPLVVFCPALTSNTWPRIAKGKMFAVNVLTEDQHDVAMRFGRSGTRKFDGVKWMPDAAGSPVIDGVLTWAGCEIEAVHPGGDHNVVIGRVRELGECGSQRPLLFYRGRFATSAESGGPPEVVETLLAWPRHADWM